jgi:c(7)-type cytochrome triheme protein
MGLVALLLAGPSIAKAATAAPIDSSQPAYQPPLKLPADFVYRYGGVRDSSVIFSHQSHVSLAGGQCTSCHPKLFKMLAPSPTPHHGEMNAGGSCGTCHDGTRAFGVKDAASCQACHSGIRPPAPAGTSGKAPDATSARPLPKPHRFPTGGDSPGPVIFAHEAHVRGAVACITCHPKPWRMASSPPLPSGGMHEKDACGSCHDGKKTFATDDADACTRCHHETGAHP